MWRDWKTETSSNDKTSFSIFGRCWLAKTMTNWVISKLDVSRIRFSVFDGENSDKLAHFLTNSDQNSLQNIKVCIYLWPDLWAQHALGKMRWWFGVILMIMIIIGLADVDDDIKLVCTYLESNHFGSKILRVCNPQLLISWRILTQLDLFFCNQLSKNIFVQILIYL